MTFSLHEKQQPEKLLLVKQNEGDGIGCEIKTYTTVSYAERERYCGTATLGFYSPNPLLCNAAHRLPESYVLPERPRFTSGSDIP